MHKQGAPQSLTDNFHPSQLEARFGGQAETPKVFWPPVIPTNKFNDETDLSEEYFTVDN